MAAAPITRFRDDLVPDILGRLRAEYGFSKQSGNRLSGGRCPQCEKKELWTWLESPFHVQCNRLNKCGWQSPTKALFPDIFRDFNQRYPSTETDPTATAKAYLRYARGIDPARIDGWFEQGTFWKETADRGTATVRFSLADGVYWEKLIDSVILTTPTGKETRTENFRGKNGGLWWAPPDLESHLSVRAPVIHLAEGIFDALSLHLSGKPAVSIMACRNFPDLAIKPYLSRNIRWVLALDPDPAGRAAALKHLKTLRSMGEKAGCILPSGDADKLDWNDLYQRGELESPDAWRRFAYYGDLHTAETREEKATCIFRQHGLHRFVFDFGARTHAFKLDVDKFQRASEQARDVQALIGDEEGQRIYAMEQSRTITEIGTFVMEFRYFEKPENGDDGRHFFKLQFPNGASAQNISLSGRALASAADFKKSLTADAPGALFTGTGDHLDMLYKAWFRKRHRTITTIDYIGYDREAKAYLFNDFAIQGGSVIPTNDDEYVDLGKMGGRKSLTPIRLHLAEEIDTRWHKDFVAGFGVKGLCALAYWTGALLAEQIRDRHESYPFLELCGEPGSGKSRLLEFLWKLVGRKNYEGFNPKVSSMIGRMREMSKVSNLPVVMIEANRAEERAHEKSINFDEFLPSFDGQIGRVTGLKSTGNETRDPPFRGVLVFAQNTPIAASEAFASRLVQIPWDRTHHTRDGGDAVERLNLLPVAQISGWVRHVCCQEARILEHFNAAAPRHERWLLANTTVKMTRIAKCHGQMLALLDCLALLLPLDEHLLTIASGYLARAAIERQSALNSDHPTVARFWDTYFYLDSAAKKDALDNIIGEETGLMNHSHHPDRELAVNLEHFHERCRERGLELFSNRDLRDLLPSSKRFPFIENRAQRSRITGTTIRCWVFSRTGGKP